MMSNYLYNNDDIKMNCEEGWKNKILSQEKIYLKKKSAVTLKQRGQSKGNR